MISSSGKAARQGIHGDRGAITDLALAQANLVWSGPSQRPYLALKRCAKQGASCLAPLCRGCSRFLRAQTRSWEMLETTFGSKRARQTCTA